MDYKEYKFWYCSCHPIVYSDPIPEGCKCWYCNQIQPPALNKIIQMFPNVVDLVAYRKKKLKLS